VRESSQALTEAIKKDARLEISCLLLDNGSNANYKGGFPFLNAVKTRNAQLLRALCAKCRLTSTSLATVIPTATKEAFYDLEMMEMLLKSSNEPSVVLNVHFRIEALKKSLSQCRNNQSFPSLRFERRHWSRLISSTCPHNKTQIYSLAFLTPIHISSP
jgi:hypothetical protein